LNYFSDEMRIDKILANLKEYKDYQGYIRDGRLEAAPIRGGKRYLGKGREDGSIKVTSKLGL